jgi:hypothetical protein
MPSAFTVVVAASTATAVASEMIEVFNAAAEGSTAVKSSTASAVTAFVVPTSRPVVATAFSSSCDDMDDAEAASADAAAASMDAMAAILAAATEASVVPEDSTMVTFLSVLTPVALALLRFIIPGEEGSVGSRTRELLRGELGEETER